MIEAKLSSKNQIVVVRGETVILLNKPKKYSLAIRGLARKPYPKRHLKKERDSWR